MGTVLIVEDQVTTRDVLTELLGKEGREIVTAVDGEEALKRLTEVPRPRVILLDLMMPRTAGWEFPRRQSADPSIADIPTIVLSGSKLSAGAQHNWHLSTLTGYELSSISITESVRVREFWKSALGPTYARGFQISAPPHGSGRRVGH
jgi:CheY-like chemotaxis protein